MATVKSFPTLGTTARAMELLHGLGVGQTEVQQTINDPIVRQRVASALKGEAPAPITQDEWLEREAEILSRICEGGKGSGMFNTESLRPTLNRAVEAWGEPTEHWRVIPGSYTLSDLFDILYRLDDEFQEEHKGKSFLFGDRIQEWWRSDSDWESLPTELGVMVCNLETCANPTDMSGAPWGLNRKEQGAWVKTQGGAEELTSAEETLVLQARSTMEGYGPLLSNGWLRCRNDRSPGSRRSLHVHWRAGDGLHVDCWIDGGRHSGCGCLPRKFICT